MQNVACGGPVFLQALVDHLSRSGPLRTRRIDASFRLKCGRHVLQPPPAAHAPALVQLPLLTSSEAPIDVFSPPHAPSMSHYILGGACPVRPAAARCCYALARSNHLTLERSTVHMRTLRSKAADWSTRSGAAASAHPTPRMAAARAAAAYCQA